MIIQYLAEIAFKIDWQKFASLPGADPIFLNNAEPHRGLNRKASNYSDKENYQLYVVFDAVAEDNTGVTTNYRAISPEIKANDYNEPSVTPRDFTCNIKIKDLSGHDITAFIDVAGPVLMECTWALVNGGDIANYSDTWAIHRIEILKNTSYFIYELSSIRPNLSAQPLQSESGETGVKVTVAGNTVVTTCLIDGAQLTAGRDYKVSARLGLFAVDYEPPIALIDNISPDTETGITDFNIQLTPGYDSFTNSDTIEIKVYRQSDNFLLETITGNFNDNISAFTSDIVDSIINYSTGTVDDNTSISFNKLSWAQNQELINDDAIALRFDLSVTQVITGLTSNIASGIFATELQEAKYNGDLRYLDTDDRKIYTGQAIATSTNTIALDLTLKYSQILFTTTDTIRSVKINGDSTYGTPFSKIFINEASSISPFQKISQMDTADGETWTPSFIIDNYAGAAKLGNNIIKDDIRTANGQPVLWVGTEDSSSTPNKYLYMIYYDGSAWQSVDFSTKLSSVSASSAARYTACISYQGVMFGLVDANNVNNEHRIFRLTQLSGSNTLISDFINPVNWGVAGLMAGGGTSGSIDGSGPTARFRENFNMAMITNDGTRPLTIWVTDGGNNRIRLLTYNAGSDNYDVSTIIGSNAGDVDGTGLSARLSDCRGMVKSGLNMYIGDYGNRKIRKVVISTLAVSSFSGTGTNAFRVASVY